MVAIVARQGRQLQRYTRNGRRKVVGCIPYKFRADDLDKDAIDRRLQVLVISSQKGHEIMFPKGGWESDESIEEAASREAMEEAGVQGYVQTILGQWWYKSKSEDTHKLGYMFPLKVTEEMLHWPEMGNRKRQWVTVAEVKETCKQPWMREALARLVDRLKAGELQLSCGRCTYMETQASKPAVEGEGDSSFSRLASELRGEGMRVM